MCVDSFGFPFFVVTLHSPHCGKFAGSLIHLERHQLSAVAFVLFHSCAAGWLFPGRFLLPQHESLILWSRVCILVANVPTWKGARVCVYMAGSVQISWRLHNVSAYPRHTLVRRLTLDVIEKVRLNNAATAFFKHIFCVNMGTTDKWCVCVCVPCQLFLILFAIVLRIFHFVSCLGSRNRYQLMRASM